jgi:hypothetical protein
MAIHTFEDVTPAAMEKGLGELRNSGFTVDGSRVSGMGIEATYKLAANVLTVNVEKAPAFLDSLVENQLRSFFS